MKTYRELVYIILDELKIISDDSLWENEHVISMLNKYRALLFKQRYSDKKREIPFAYYQRLPVSFELKRSNPPLIKSRKSLPPLIDMNNMWVYIFLNQDDLMLGNFNIVNPQRFKSVGYNRWLKNEAYATIDNDLFMYIKPQNSSYSSNYNLIDESISDNQLVSENGDSFISELISGSFFHFDAILDNPLDYKDFIEDIYTDPLDMHFPCEEAMIQPVMDLSIKELGMMNQQKRDAANNANDDPSTPQQAQNG